MTSTVYGKRYENNYSYFEHPLNLGEVLVHQMGELYCETGYEVEEHLQHSLEITYVITGQGTVVVDGKEYPVKENDLAINLFGQRHAIRADRNSPLRFFYLAFFFPQKEEESRITQELRTFYASLRGFEVKDDKGLLAPFTALFNEMRCQDHFYPIMVRTQVEQILVQAARSFRQMPVSLMPQPQEGTYLGSAVCSVMRYIDRHYREIDDIQKVAGELGYSYTYLAHEFKRRMDMTIGSYIVQKKMDEAKWLLQTGRLSVSQVAQRLNYLSVQSFSNGFKKSVGMSPIEYQKIQKNAANPSN